MQNEQAEQNLYETAGAEQTERSERSETRSSVNRFAYMSAEARRFAESSAAAPTTRQPRAAYSPTGWTERCTCKQSFWDFLRTGCSDSISTME